MNIRFAAVLALLVAAPLPAFAQAASPTATPAARRGGPLEACRADINKHCPKAERIEGWRGKCLRDNTASLSDGCKAAIASLRDERQKVRAACAADIDQLCKAEADGKDARPMRCLKSNEGRLSAGCKTALSAFMTGDSDGAAGARQKP